MADQLTSTIPSLSRRAQAETSPRLTALLWEVLSDQWHPQDNPSGYVSIGVAENRLMHSELHAYIDRTFKAHDCFLTYGDGPKGSHRLRRALAQFLTKHLRSVIPLEPEHVVVTNGVTSAIEHASWAFANPGDAFLLGQPYYGAFPNDICMRPNVKLIEVRFGHELDPMSKDAVRNYEQAILDAKTQGVAVKGLMLCNPHNPLGRCYSQEVLVEYLKLCQKHKIHLVSDEIYALSVWQNNEDSSPPQLPFTSILSLDLTNLINPALVHCIWGISKDFGANGLRLACLVSQSNPAFHEALTSVALLSSASSMADHTVANLLEDAEFTDQYIQENAKRLSTAYSQVVAFLRKHKIKYTPGSNAGFFLWVDLGEAYLRKHPERRGKCDLTREVMNALLEQKLYLASGEMFGSETPGQFRIVFSHPSEYVDEALERMVKAIEVGYQGKMKAKL
ncbi:1-aminocyclopropane-1-carboxylate synthase-like protein 1 [Cyphellophora attinorum]|uniref:1-aminocyclopropane-1-carboxylate synthase-like protein 1 n=1 Tax=Cyphellophora attinorum TaxID=1664694 RepID=A0A0N1HXM7_9EURO|nr:1-aminocyclopropane-1-carboxylate synthase-like protein 1 [Phialophora attinorum]KPI45343.1 1-aminocyclopropane-1-carboxylate synthase-like protein 1 [Phialophora attinorum]